MQNIKIIIIIVIVTILVIGLVSFLLNKQKNTSTPEVQTVQEVNSNCDFYLTLNELKTLSGFAYSNVDVSNQKLGKITVMTCTYNAPGLSATIKPISVLIRNATTAEEAKTIFEESKIVSYTDGIPVTGIGEQAIWSNIFGQFSTLKGKSWIIVTANKNQELASKVATEVLRKIK